MAADGLWDAYGRGAFAFCHRLLGDVGAAADATQDAFLLAHAERPPGPGFGLALLRAARTTSFELLGGRARYVEPRARGVLSAAAARLRPQQRAALALAGLQGLSHAEIAAVLGIAREVVPTLLARARLRLHDEMHGTALAGAAVASPDCEDVLPLLAAAADGELEPADAAWADPHVARCSTCPRTIRAMRGAAATYAAWSPAATPSWLRAATLADVGTREPPTMGPARRAALPAALVGATLATAASAALLVGGARSLRPAEVSLGGAGLPDPARSVEMAAMGRAPLVGAGHDRSRGTDVVEQAAATLPPPKTVATPPPPVPAGDDDGRAPCGAGDGHHA